MAELDIEQLKRRRAETRVSINRIMFDGAQLDEIIAALEGREWLRAAAHAVCEKAESREEFNYRGDRAGWYEVPDQEFLALCDALERSDG